MSLSAALSTAKTALATNAALTSIVSQNIAGVNNPNYSRKIANVTTDSGGAATVTSVSQATDSALLSALLTAQSQNSSQTAVSNGLDQIEQTVALSNASTSTSTATSTTDTSPSTMIAGLASALQAYAAAPSSTASGQAVVTAAQALTANLNTASSTVQSIREQADASIASSVQTINSLLAQYQTADQAVMVAQKTGGDATTAIDQRTTILKSLSQQIGITTVNDPNGGVSIYTDSGATLFQGTARTVTFNSTAAYGAATTGNAVYVDGVAVTGPNAPMPIQSGAIAGNVQLRDVTTVQYQNQLDQIAQGLVNSFAETDQTGGSAPTIAGLFTAPGVSATATTAQVGLAGTITVNANVDPTSGGVLTRLRDGGIGAPGNSAYVANTTGAASYSAHLDAFLTSLDQTRSFNPASGGIASGTVASYADSSVGWLESTRQTAKSATANSDASLSATTTSLSNATGVNLDDELSKMLDLEHAYSASADLITTVKNMLDSLLAAVSAS